MSSHHFPTSLPISSTAGSLNSSNNICVCVCVLERESENFNFSIGGICNGFCSFLLSVTLFIFISLCMIPVSVRTLHLE
ncbi:hypothetical protein QVD17_36453 [Tagetes erecta]|uniref:Uncharacterized protein n=1 Tax=Tagetes erecta TaxID=13708 RepID=A0AAD8NJ86_TARER|nr:hypothetical protein QVD17_36453 [Tagetes erecta]